MKKIVIIGSPGAGKTTFAQVLSQRLNIEVFHLDRYFWREGWQELPREERIQIEQQSILTKDAWIIEGCYLGTSERRLAKADTIIVLDMNPLLCIWSVLKRYTQCHGYTRPDLATGCIERFNPGFLKKILVFFYHDRRQLLTKIEEMQTHQTDTQEEKTIIVLHSRKQVMACRLAVAQVA